MKLLIQKCAWQPMNHTTVKKFKVWSTYYCIVNTQTLKKTETFFMPNTKMTNEPVYK